MDKHPDDLLTGDGDPFKGDPNFMASLARGLERRGHSVAVIDIMQDAFRRLGPQFQGKTGMVKIMN